MENRKPVKNVLYNWRTTDQYGDMRIIGRVRCDQPDIFVFSGEVIVTSPIVAIERERDELRLITRNSVYILE